VAVSQSFMDVGTGYLILLILLNQGVPRKWAIFGMTLYLFNPFSIFYVPLTSTETFATFEAIYIFFKSQKSSKLKHFLFLGLLCGMATLTKQHLGILLPTLILYLIHRRDHDFLYLFRSIIILVTGFLLVMIPWTIRNYALTGELIVLKGETPGYPVTQEDNVSIYRFYNHYFIDTGSIWRSIYLTGEDGIEDHSIFGNQKEEVAAAARLAFECGPSAYHAREKKFSITDYRGCKDEVVRRYNSLTDQAASERSLFEAAKMPFYRF